MLELIRKGFVEPSPGKLIRGDAERRDMNLHNALDAASALFFSLILQLPMVEILELLALQEGNE